MKRLLILISGEIGVGKDISANIIESIYGYENVYMQAMAKSLKGITVDLQQVASLTSHQEENISTLQQLEKTEDQPDKHLLFGMNTRELLSSLGYILKSNMGEDVFPVMFLHRWQKSGCQVGIVPDVRFDELDSFQDLLKDTDIVMKHIIIKGPVRNRKYANVGLPTLPRCSETITVLNNDTVVELEKILKHTLPPLPQQPKQLQKQKLGVSIAEFSKLARKADIPSSPKLATLDEVKFITRMVLSELQEIHVSTLHPTNFLLTDFMLECLDQVDVPKKLNKNVWTDEEILVEQYDGLADAIYYMYDFAGRHGVNLDLLLDEIHQANMNKKFPDGTFHNREDGKVLKPPGWKEPDILAILNKQQW